MNAFQRRRRALMMQAAAAPAPVHGTWEDLFAKIADGTYATAYSVGEILPLDLGTEGVVDAQIVGFNVDSKADNSGNARVSFVTKYCCNTKKTWNPARTPSSAPYDEGTGSVGGWSKCTLRTYVNGTIKGLIPSDIRSRIVSVKKYSRYYSTTDSVVRNGTSDEDVWIPSKHELGFTQSDSETSGAVYSAVFTGNSARSKSKKGSSADVYWTRTAGNGSSTIGLISNTGTAVSTGNPQTSRLVVFGFCID